MIYCFIGFLEKKYTLTFWQHGDEGLLNPVLSQICALDNGIKCSEKLKCMFTTDHAKQVVEINIKID